MAMIDPRIGRQGLAEAAGDGTTRAVAAHGVTVPVSVGTATVFIVTIDEMMPAPLPTPWPERRHQPAASE